MQDVVAIGTFAFAFCVALALVGSHFRGRHKRGAMATRLLIGIPLLATYAYSALYLTILGRTTGPDHLAKLEIFWSHRESLSLTENGLSITNAGLLVEIILNVLLFVPLGALLPFLIPSLIRRGKTKRGVVIVALVASGCSLAIELVQWLFRLGLFEFDDVLDNTLGAIMGYTAFWLVWRRPWSRQAERP